MQEAMLNVMGDVALSLSKGSNQEGRAAFW